MAKKNAPKGQVKEVTPAAAYSRAPDSLIGHNYVPKGRVVVTNGKNDPVDSHTDRYQSRPVFPPGDDRNDED